jgi:hypothetical protein
MAAQQNVASALKGGPIVIIAALSSVVLCFGAVALLGRIGRGDDRIAEDVDRGRSIIGGELSDTARRTATAAPSDE